MANPFQESFQAAQGQPQQNPMAMLMQLMQVKQAMEAGKLNELKMQEAQEKRQFFSPQNQAQFMTPGTPGVAVPSDEAGGGPGYAAVAPQLDMNKMLAAAASRNFIPPETYANHLAQREQARANHELAKQTKLDNLMRWQAELASKNDNSEQGRLNQLRIAEMIDGTKRDMAAFMVANRQPRAERPLQLTTDAEGNQLIVNSDGTTHPLIAPGGGGVRKPVGTDKPMTEFQGKAALYGTRAAQSDKVLKALEDKISTTGLAMGQATGVVGNVLMSSEQRRVNQAQRDFVNAVLRQESGAVISDAEFDNAKKQYFPTTGDEKPELDQKRANRQLAIQGFARMAGPKGAADIKAIIDNSLLPGVNPNAVTPQENRRASDKVPLTNARGWRLMTDAKGNKAYVGPNQEVEEVK